MTRSREHDRGFTLIEILVGIVVVGILAVLVILGITSLTSKSASAACTNSRDAASAAAVAYYTNHGSFPPTLTAMSGNTPPELNLPAGTTIDATGLVASNSNWSLTMTPGAADVAPSFSCGSGAAGAATTSSAATTTTASTIPGGGGGTTTAAGATTTAAGATTTAAGATTTAAPTTTAAGATTTAAGATTTTVFSSSNGTAACPGSFSGWVGEYYSNTTVSGTPTLCRNDSSINFNWGNSSPGAGVPADGFSVRWTESVSFTAGQYTFRMGSADGSRLYIDGVKVLDQWRDQSYTTRSVDRTVTAGTHTIVMEFYDNTGASRATLTWARAN